MTTNSASRNNLAWLLDGLVEVPRVLYAVVLSTDGLIIQKSTQLAQDMADVMAAAACSLHSLARGAGQHFDSGPVQQVIVEYGDKTLFVAEAGHNARLAVVCEQAVDMGTVAYEMSRLVTRIGEFLGTGDRGPALSGPALSGPALSANGQSGVGHEG